ncbi:hypothetical protein LCGC14_0516360 [marine sediment metagenome]|uniref:Uncharacterized protein n=1 Tax=marine sediment metagenome TaxID=412755 RepID=A0A0F9V7X3_9ZZZZ
MSREDRPDRKMDIREYKEYCKGKHGEKSVNDSLLKNINRATGGRTLSRSEFDKVHAKIKIGQELKKEQ